MGARAAWASGYFDACIVDWRWCRVDSGCGRNMVGIVGSAVVGADGDKLT
jgi:hypothetical protein